MNEAQFRDLIGRNRFNRELLDRLRDLSLRDCHLVAGCLFQAVWNARSGHPPEQGVKDYDVFYHDDADLSEEAEEAAARRVQSAIADLPIKLDVKNQARVHHWYASKFGGTYPRLRDSRDGIDRYLVSCTCVGITAASGEVYATHGLDDLAAGVLRMNPNNPRPDLFPAKAESYRSRWPWLTIAS